MQGFFFLYNNLQINAGTHFVIKVITTLKKNFNFVVLIYVAVTVKAWLQTVKVKKVTT